MTNKRRQLGALGTEGWSRPLDLDAPLRWACSARGWNCCVDKGVPVFPYDIIRLRSATGRSAQELINEGTVTFLWYPTSGALVGMLARRPHDSGHERCVFLEEMTPSDLRARRETDPAAFRALPDFVQRAAGSDSGEWRVAGLCAAHAGRPGACRNFPFARQSHLEAASGRFDVEIRQTNYCGPCALSNVTTTPREVLLSEGAEDYWRASDVFEALTSYLRGLGLAGIESPSYARLPVDDARRTQLWAALYVPEANADVSALDDLATYRVLVEHAIAEAERLVEECGADPAALGFEEERGRIARPDLDALLDPARPLLPERPAALPLTG